ncbi:MAG: hypothetical protein AAGA48_05940 [Myxococcota bacterium]
MLGLWSALLGCSGTFEVDQNWPSAPWDTGFPWVCTTTLVSWSPIGEDVNRHRVVTVDLPPERLIEALEIDLLVEMFSSRAGWLPVSGSTYVTDSSAAIRLQFSPDVPFAPLTRHRVVARSPACDPLVVFEFQTNEIGARVQNPEEALGQVFVGNTANASLTQPASAGPYFGPTGPVRFVIDNIDPVSETFGMTASRQPLDIYKDSEPPVPLFGRWSNPGFNVSGPVFPLHVGPGLPVEIRNATLSGDLSPDRQQLAGLVLRGTLDFRQLTLGADAEELCAEFTESGLCDPCEDGTLNCAVAEFRDWAAQRVNSY